MGFLSMGLCKSPSCWALRSVRAQGVLRTVTMPEEEPRAECVPSQKGMHLQCAWRAERREHMLCPQNSRPVVCEAVVSCPD